MKNIGLFREIKDITINYPFLVKMILSLNGLSHPPSTPESPL